jgi:hypothetical protein
VEKRTSWPRQSLEKEHFILKLHPNTPSKKAFKSSRIYFKPHARVAHAAALPTTLDCAAPTSCPPAGFETT